MTDIFGSLLGAAASIGSAAAAPAPSSAYRGADYNPVTNINAPGATDFAGLSSLVNSIETGNNIGAQSFFSPETAVPQGGVQSGIGNALSNPLILIAVVGIVGILLWRKFGT